MSKKSANKTKPGVLPRINLEPWQDESGNTFPLKRLKSESRHWDAETWERYLQTLEGPQTEVLVDDFEGLLRQHDVKQSLQAFYGERGPEIEISAEALHVAVGELSGKQQVIVRKYFWENKSFDEIARELGRAKPVVWRAFRKAIKQLKTTLENRH